MRINLPVANPEKRSLHSSPIFFIDLLLSDLEFIIYDGNELIWFKINNNEIFFDFFRHNGGGEAATNGR